MKLSHSEMFCMLFLESLSDGKGLADGCDTGSMAKLGLIEMIGEAWTITAAGQTHLAQLQAIHASC